MSIAAMFNAASPLGPMHCWSFGNSDVRALTGGIDKLPVSGAILAGVTSAARSADLLSIYSPI